ncbi:MAG: ferrochelatase [Bacteroidetes bacterium]|nr:ferrochelatase [Bacteroidota bacterium]
MNAKKGILLVNLGTPDAPERSAVHRYLRQFLLDPRVIDIPWLKRNLLVRGLILPFRTGNSTKLYQQLWMKEGSPLKVYGERLAKGVQEVLGNGYAVELAMRYQQPSIELALERLLVQQVSDIVVFPLFPQYASASTGSVHEEVMRVLAKKQAIPGLRFINSYPDYGPMIDIFVENSRPFDPGSYDHILFSYHGLPQRQLRKADDCNHCLQSPNCCRTLSAKNQFCYAAQCHATTAALAKKLGLSGGRYTTCFQSRLGRDPWVQPYTSEVVEERAKHGDKKILVFCPAFVADCLETTIEVLVEYREEFLAKGGQQLDLVPSLNDHPRWMQVVADFIKNRG